ncbi:GerAB/ArcD/ProY family transporter [Niallia sp. 03133]|uniref:GerAB/ArcD/ProY family transporter n=1 Tax=Niallia sp. 03133 TaxID=3458060 RepID=UPI00404498CD
MLEKQKISALQMAMLMQPTITATAILVVPAITGNYAGRDMWMSPIIGSIMGFATLFIIYALHKRFPNETLIEYSEKIMGPFLGKVAGLAYLFFVFHACGIITRQYTDFIINSFLPTTPMYVMIGSLVLISAFAVRSGLEVIGRCAQLLIPLFLASPLFLFLLLAEWRLGNMLPIMENGIKPVLLGASLPQAWFSEISLVSMMLPFLTDQKKGLKWGAISIMIITIFLTFENIISVFLFGSSTSEYNYPIFSAFRYISIPPFFEHMDVCLVVVWVIGVFIKLSVFYYVFCLGTAQMLKLSNYRSIVYPLGLFIVVMSFWVAPSTAELNELFALTDPFYITSAMMMLPLFLLFVALIRRKKSVLTRTVDKK